MAACRGRRGEWWLRVGRRLGGKGEGISQPRGTGRRGRHSSVGGTEQIIQCYQQDQRFFEKDIKIPKNLVNPSINYWPLPEVEYGLGGGKVLNISVLEAGRGQGGQHRLPVVVLQRILPPTRPMIF